MPFRTSGPEGSRRERLSGVQNNVRSMLAGITTPAASSVYTRSPNPQQSPDNGTPKPPSPRGLFGLVRQQTAPTARPTQASLHLPLDLPGATMNYSPASQPSEWLREPAEPEPAAQGTFRHPADTVPIMDEERDLEAAIPPHRTRKHKRRRRHRREAAWVRRHGQRRKSSTCMPLAHGHTRMKFMACIISGLFLASMLTIYLTIALTVKGLGQELHVLFILTIIGTTIFFAHSLIRLCIMVLRPPRHRNRIPSVAGPEGFKPDVPIRVQMARDEEIVAQEEDGTIADDKLEALKAPPPAYGLWRCSVRIDPNLLHWQRAQQAEDAANAANETTETTQSSPVATASASDSPRLENIEEAPQQPRRPPSYASDDGVSYVVSALPPRPPSEIHPALRIRLP